MKTIIRKTSGLAALAAILLSAGALSPQTAFADDETPTPLALRMRVMGESLKAISRPETHPAGVTELDMLLRLKEAVADCRDNAEALAPAHVLRNPVLLDEFKADFAVLFEAVEALEQALLVPADIAGRDLQIQLTINELNRLKKEAHAKYRE